MNAAFLLVTTAWLAGDVPAGSGCCNTCDSCCGDSWGHRLRDRLRGMFNRGDCCGSTCDSCCGSTSRWHGWSSGHSCGHGCGHSNSCCTPSCDPCCGSGGNLLGRLRGMFNRHGHGDCCDSCCGGTSVAPKAGEVIPTPPKKMPSPSGKEPPAKEIRIETPSGLVPNSPAIQPPAINPSADPAIDNRNPF
ncbi:MAG: hypothetical protein HY040_24145 [Planctomycetes bacterium]|nr:hypothetical protein [Planctomycetota bacterium]